MALSKFRPSAGPLSGANVEPALVPESVQEQIETNPIPQSMRLVQPGIGATALNRAPLEPGAVPRSELTQLPEYTVQDVATDNEFGPTDLTAETIPVDATQQMVDVEEQAFKYAEPTIAPDFSSPDNAYATMQTAIEDLGPTYQAFNVADQKSIKFKDDEGSEAIAVSNYANAFAKPLLNEEGIWANETLANMTESSLGINAQNANALGGALMLTAVSALSDVQKRKYKQFIEDKKSGMIEGEYDTYIGKNLSASSEDIGADFQEVVAASNNAPTEQPVMQGFVADIQDKLGKNFSQPNTPGGRYAPRNVPREVAQAHAYQMYKDGYYVIKKDKYGTYYPILTSKGEELVSDVRHMASVYDVKLRHMNINEPLILSQSNPAVNNALAGKGSQYISKDGRVLDGKMNIIDAAINMLNAVPVRINVGAASVLAQMASDAFPINPETGLEMGTARFTENGAYIQDNSTMFSNAPFNYSNETMVIPNAYSNSVFAKTMADLSLDKVKEKVKELVEDNVSPGEISAIVSDINEKKITQVYKHINQYIGGNVSRGNRFNLLKRSDSTNRMFPMATDINVTNHSGTIRPATEFGVKYSATVPMGMGNTVLRAKDLSKRVFVDAVKGKTGISLGVAVNDALWSLPKSDRVLLDAYYQIAKIADDFGLLKIDGNRPTPHDFIMALDRDTFEKVASYGSVFKSWTEGNLPTSNSVANLPPAFNNELSKFFAKKEWGPRMSNAMMAKDILDASKNGGVVQLAATIETDASQSNAAIISLLIGDLKIANILGMYLGPDEAFAQDRETYKDLRGLVTSSLDEDIDLTMTGPDEQIKKAAISKFLNEARVIHGSAFDKMYARGIVVAGLYGKHAEYMFTEVENMLASIGLSDKLDKVESLYDSRQEMLEDVSSIYATSMKKHLANLQGWQKITSSIASLKAAFNGSTEVKSFGNTTVELGTSYATLLDDESNTVKKILGLPEELGSMSGMANNLSATGDVQKPLADIRSMKARLEEVNLNIDDVLDQIYTYAFPGDKARKAMPVVLIQSGDAYEMASSYIYANQKNKDDEPLNMLGIHDAQITAPGSTLLMYNAYNNISTYILAKEGRPLLQSLKESYNEDYKNAMADIKKAGKANIGTLGKYKSMGGYFDKIYVGSHFIPRDVKRGRPDLNPEYTKVSKEYNDKVLDLAMTFGWKPPTKRNKDDRSNLMVTPREFELLSRLLEIHNGWAAKGESTFPELDAIASKYKQKTKMNFNYANRNLKKYNNFLGANDVIVDQMKSNKNFIVNSK
jgi:hypothetical protein